MEYRAKAPGRVGVPVSVVAGDRIDLSLTLPRGAVITGRVLDARGRPVTDAAVRALSLRAGVEGPALVTPPGATPTESVTDDRGEFRIYGLPPGAYFVGATPPPAAVVGREVTDAEVAWARRLADGTATSSAAHTLAPAPGATMALAPTFHPAGRTIAEARRIELAAGEERSDVDVALTAEPVFTLAGAVVGSDGRAAPSARLTLLPAGLSVPTTRFGSSATPGLGYSYGGVVNVVASAQGTFEIRSLAAGEYLLIARASRPGQSGVAEWASTTVRVEPRDRTEIVVPLEPTTTVTATLQVDPDAPRPPLATVSLTLSPQSSAPTAVTIAGVKPDADGRVVIRGVVPGAYRIAVSGLAPPWMPRSAMAGGRDVLDAPLAVAGTDVSVVIELTPRSGRIAGTFTDASGRPASDYLVVVFPADRRQWHTGSRRIRAVRPATDGRYVADGLPAGDYRLAAVPDAEPDEWHDPAFLESLLPAAIPVAIGDGESRAQDFRIAGQFDKARLDYRQLWPPWGTTSHSFCDSCVAPPASRSPRLRR
jgi:hypothetical protein